MAETPTDHPRPVADPDDAPTPRERAIADAMEWLRRDDMGVPQTVEPRELIQALRAALEDAADPEDEADKPRSYREALATFTDLRDLHDRWAEYLAESGVRLPPLKLREVAALLLIHQAPQSLNSIRRELARDRELKLGIARRALSKSLARLEQLGLIRSHDHSGRGGPRWFPAGTAR